MPLAESPKSQALEQTPAHLGAKLHDARERHGLSLSQIANSTKIPVNMLEALESNDIARLPANVYGRGFVRSFAAEVGLDPEAAVAEFVALLPPDVQGAEPPALEPVEENQTPDPELLRRPMLVGLATGGALIVLILLLGAPIVSYVGRKRGQPGATPSSPSGVIGAREMPQWLATPPAPLTSLRTLPLAGDAASPGSDRAAAAPPPPGPEVTHAPEVPVADPASSIEADPPLRAIADHVVVGLSVTRPSWVIATVDAKRAVNRLLQVGEEETLNVQHDLVLTAGDAGAIVMTLNGTAARSIGGTGETVKVRIDRTNFQKYLAHQ